VTRQRPKLSLLFPCLLFFLAATSAQALDPNTRLSQYAHSSWLRQDGLYDGMPYRIAQTTDGYIWIGTKSGLVRFDGVRFVDWTPPLGEKLPSQRIESLLVARDGSLWIGSAAGLSRWQHERLTNYPIEAVVPAIVEAQNGTIWFRTLHPNGEYKLCEVIRDGIRCYGKDDGITGELIGHGLAEDDKGTFWIGEAKSLIRWTPESHREYRPRGLQSNAGSLGVSDIVPTSDGSLWIGIDRSGPGLGLQQFVNGVWKTFAADGFDGSKIRVLELLLDRQNALWVATDHSGIYRIYGKRVEHFGSADGLSSDNVTQIVEDHEGNVWAVTSKGIDNFRPLHVVTFSTREGLTTTEVDSVLAGREGLVWIGGPNALIALRDGRVSSMIEHLPGALVTSLFEDHAGRLWVGMDDFLTVYQKGRFRRIDRANNRATGMIVGITEDVSHNIWVESKGPPMTLMRIEDFRVREEFPAPQTPAARRIAPDPAGGLWLGLINGDLARFHGGHTETFQFEHHPDSRVEQMTVNADGSVLAATASGLRGWKRGKLSTLTVRNGLPCDVAYGLVTDDRANLWIYLGCGLVEVSSADLQNWWNDPNFVVHPRVFDAKDGAQPERAAFGSAARSSDGRLWFANWAALQMIDPENLAENSVPPPVQIEGVVADRKRYAADGRVQLGALTRDLEVDYTALSFANPQKVKFRYKLEGHDANWQDAGTRRQAFYTNLRPGRYSFRVIACNNDGVWNEQGATLEFKILPAFYQTNWFLMLIVAVIGYLVWATYQWRVRQMAKRLELQFDARLSERTRIAQDLHDTLLQGFISASMQLGVANRQLASDSPAKLIVTDVLKLMRQVIEEGRKAVRGMRLSSTETDDLQQAFSRVPQELALQQPINFRVLVEGQVRTLRPMIRDEVYRVGREALANAFRHSQAANIEVELEYSDRELRLLVRDNGCGIDPLVLQSGRDGHWGLSGMRERAGRIGARLKVWSNGKAGTEVELSVPGGVAFQSNSPRRYLQWFDWFRRQPEGDDAQEPGDKR
jgi:signal transduction histidine kinase/ligand-binding sensor domain-containing protein